MPYDRIEYEKHIGNTYTQQEFFNLFPNYTPLKVLSANMTHYDYTYTMGHNKIKEFCTEKPCSAGGFYLADKNDIANFASYGPNIATISLPKTALIHIETGKIKVSELCIDNIININSFDEHYKIEWVKQNCSAIMYIENPSVEVQLTAVKETQLTAVKRDGRVIRYINNPSEEVQLASVKQNCRSIRYIKNPSEEVKLIATNQISYVLRYILDPIDDFITNLFGL